MTLCFLGWGQLTAWLMDAAGKGRTRLASSLRPLDLGIVGLAATYVYSVAVTLVAPLNEIAGAIFVGAGAVGVIGASMTRLRSMDRKISDLVWFMALTAFTAYGTSLTPLNYDAGLYQLQFIAYLTSGPLPLGIANIHTRLGFNSAWTPLSALCSRSVLGAETLYLLNAVAILIFLGAMLSHLADRLRRQAFGLSAAYAGAVCMLALWDACGALFSWFGLSPTADVPSALSCCYAFLPFLSLTEEYAGGKLANSDDEKQRLLFMLVTASVLAIVLKVSQAPVMILTLAPLLLLRSLGLPARVYRPAVVLGSAAIAVWLIQGLMISGCVAFPAASSCLQSLPWSVSPGAAAWQGDMVRTWAKAPTVRPEDIPSGLAWIPLWRDKMLSHREFVWSLCSGAMVLLALAVAFVGSYGLMILKLRPGVVFLKSISFAIAVALAGLAFWFVTAPDPRFGLGFLIATPALIFAGLCGLAAPEAASRGRLVAAILVLLVVGGTVHAVVRLHGERSGADAYAWTHIPEPRVLMKMSAGGVRMRVPAAGDQCWSVVPPCTPESGIGLRQSTFFGHTLYSHDGPQEAAHLAVQEPVPAAAGGPAFLVALGPHVWGAETAVVSGKPYSVRWLQAETEFTVTNETGKQQDVILFISLGTYQRPRHVYLVAGDKRLPEVNQVTNDFFAQGPQLVQFRTALQAGRNSFSLKTAEPLGMLPPGNRPAALLLVGDIRVEQLPR